MIFTPTRVHLAASASEGMTALNAFDNALLKMGLANYNLVKVSSVFPPGARIIDHIDLPSGSLVPSVYAAYTCQESGVGIAAAISLGIPGDASKAGVIMEHSGRCSEEDVRARAEGMVRNAMKARSIEDYSIESASVWHRVESCGCAVALLFLLP